ncbi:helix-turn-helix transcriptional regulator [Nocardioides sp. TF02-7]|uniref:helix-turn-helix domain-containing protein n=1 Tax=Nocardioides sp. TF02-7 TaxID=2917724 RepID=UPI001F05FA62|nr:helix-turn-helix transcriptional regulator [Nocardioides sp. TF02-7]UMG93930.1 helix-turn-helix transcriptional regulator [Nocardioides sp. TF02-7]
MTSEVMGAWVGPPVGWAPWTSPSASWSGEWRQRRHLSQLDLANLAEVSTRHLSYVENGRSRPTSGMILRLCERLDVPLRDQNRMLLAGGFAPAHPEHRLTDPPMAEANAALEAILQAHLPYPALVVDRHWELVTANEAAFSIFDGVDDDLLEPPVNVIRLSVHPRGLAPRIANLAEWRAHLAHRLRREHEATGDPSCASCSRRLPMATAAHPGRPRSSYRWSCGSPTTPCCRSSRPPRSSGRPGR